MLLHNRLFISVAVALAGIGSASAKDCIVSDFGAAADGKTLDTPVIQRAIDACAQSGGGTVTLPLGDYLTGTINLRSNVEFRFAKGARLVATTDLSAYQKHNDELAGVFYTEDADNVAITGPGTIFGQGMEFMYADSAKTISGPVLDYVRQGKDLRKVTDGVGDGPLHPRDRFHQMIVFSNCTGLTLTDFTCQDSPYWCFVIVHCDRVRVSGLTIDNNLLIPNSDGLDIISSRNVNVSDCYISCGDDAIVLAGYDWHFGDPGFRRITRPSDNININNCILRSRSSAIRIGGWDQNVMSNYNLSNITIFDSNAGINIQIRDYAGIENVNFSNINIETRLHTGDWWGNGEPIRISTMHGRDSQPGAIRNVRFNNITCNSENSIYIYAEPGCVIDGVDFSNFTFNMRQGKNAAVTGGNIDMRPTTVPEREFFASDIPVVHVENATRVRFASGAVTWSPDVKESYFTVPVYARNVDTLTLTDVSLQPSPANPKLPTVMTVNCKNVKK